MSHVTPAVMLPCAAVSKIDFEEHEEILAGLHSVSIHDLGEVCVRVGVTATGAMVVLLNGMSDWSAVVSKLAT